MRTVEFNAPGMAIKKVDENGKIHYHQVVEKLRKKFENTKTNVKVRELKIKPGNALRSYYSDSPPVNLHPIF